MKKKLFILIAILIAVMLVAVQTNFTWETDTITTTASYSTATDTEINTQAYMGKFIHIENAGAVNSMYFTAWGYGYNQSSYYEEFITDESIAASGSYDIKLNNTAYSKVIIRVKNNAGSTTCKISYNLIP